MLSELLYKICCKPDTFSPLHPSFSSPSILHSKMSQTDERVVYPKLQGAANYHSWRQNMISLFKKEGAYEIAVGKEPKPEEPAYPKKLTKVQFSRLITAERQVVS